MAKAIDFILKAKGANLGRPLVKAVSDAINAGTLAARQAAISQITDLMRNEGVTEEDELDRARDIYDSLSDFLTNTNFDLSSIPPGRY